MRKYEFDKIMLPDKPARVYSILKGTACEGLATIHKYYYAAYKHFYLYRHSQALQSSTR